MNGRISCLILFTINIFEICSLGVFPQKTIFMTQSWVKNKGYMILRLAHSCTTWNSKYIHMENAFLQKHQQSSISSSSLSAGRMRFVPKMNTIFQVVNSSASKSRFLKQHVWTANCALDNNIPSQSILVALTLNPYITILVLSLRHNTQCPQLKREQGCIWLTCSFHRPLAPQQEGIAKGYSGRKTASAMVDWKKPERGKSQGESCTLPAVAHPPASPDQAPLPNRVLLGLVIASSPSPADKQTRPLRTLQI